MDSEETSLFSKCALNVMGAGKAFKMQAHVSFNLPRKTKPGCSWTCSQEHLPVVNVEIITTTSASHSWLIKPGSYLHVRLSPTLTE